MEDSSDITIDTEDEFISSSTAVSIDISNLSNSDEGSMMMEVGRYVTVVELEVVVPAQTQVDLMVGGERADVLLNSRDEDMQSDLEVAFPISEREVRVVFAISSLSSGIQVSDVELLLTRTGNANGFVNVSLDLESAYAMDADEERVVTGRPGLGTVKVFKKNDDGTYENEQSLSPPVGDADAFGYSVSIDGDFLAVGAHREDSESLGVFANSSSEITEEVLGSNSSGQSGAVYVWQKHTAEQSDVNYDDVDEVVEETESSEADEYWELVYFIKPEEANADQFFGHEVEILDHGKGLFTLAVAHPGYAERLRQHPNVLKEPKRKGKVSIYSNVNTSNKALEFKQTLQVDDLFIDKHDFFGNDIEMNENLLVVAAKYERSDSHHLINDSAQNSGAVFVYSRNSNRDLFEDDYTFLKARRIYIGDRFGASIALDRDTIFVGAPKDASTQSGVNEGQDHTRATSNSGAVHVYRRQDTGTWVYEAFIKPPITEPNMFFGASVSAEKGVLAVGTPHEDGNAESTLGQYRSGGANNSGAVFVYGRELETRSWVELDYLKEENPQPDRQMGIKPLRVVGGEVFVTSGRRFGNF